MRPTSDHSVAHLPDDNDVACSDLATCGPHSEQSAAKVFVDVKDNASSLFILILFIYLFRSWTGAGSGEIRTKMPSVSRSD